MLVDFFSKPIFQKRDYSDVSAGVAAQALKSYLHKEAPSVCADKDAICFYCFNHALGVLSTKYKGTAPLPEEAQQILDAYTNHVTPTLLRVYYYLLIICIREARHCKGGPHDSYDFLKYLESRYSRETAGFMNHLSVANGSEAVGDFLELPVTTKISYGELVTALCDVFYNCDFSGGYGGKPWGKIASSLKGFVFGKVSLETLGDTAWTLAHNNGPIFNKSYIYTGYTSSLLTILDVQRAGQIPKLIWDDIYGVSYLDNGFDYFHKTYDFLVTNLGHTPEFVGNIDWCLVELLGSVQEYSKHIKQQQTVYGASPYADKVTDMYKVIQNNNDYKLATKQAHAFIVGGDVRLKKLAREEL